MALTGICNSVDSPYVHESCVVARSSSEADEFRLRPAKPGCVGRPAALIGTGFHSIS